MRCKRGQQTGSPAAALIGIMIILFLFYILFLPPAERESLLEGENVSDLDDEDRILLDVAPGRLSFADKNVFDHSIPNVFLTEHVNAVLLGSENAFVVSKGWFSDQRKSVLFSVSDLEYTENVLLSFQAAERFGVLVIHLNGERIFEGVIASQNPVPILLPKSLLRATNVLEFSVDGGFWSKKRFSLSDVKIIGDITDVKKQMASNTFSISNTELDNFETSFLEFYPICDQRSAGVMSVELNGRVIHSAVPACDSLNRIDLFVDDLRVGKNTLVFNIVSGSYRVEQVRVRVLLRPVKSFVEYFNVKSSLFNDVLDKVENVVLFVEFIDDGGLKRAELNVNGRLSVINQRDADFELDISKLVREGNNYLEIRPLTELDIAKVEVRVE